MADLTFRKLLGHRVAWALALAVLVGALWIPAGAQAASAVPGLPSADTAVPEVPAAAQAAVNSALAQAGVGAVERAPVADVPAIAPSTSSSPSPVPAPSVSSPPVLRSTAVVTAPVVHLEVPTSVSPASSVPIPDPAPVAENGAGLAVSTTPRPDSAALAAAGHRTGGVSDVLRSRPSGRVRVLGAPHRSFGRGEPLVPARPIELGTVRATVAAAGWPRLVRTHRVAPPPRVVIAPHRTHKRVAAAASTAAAATAVEPVSPSVPASLPPAGAGVAGPGAGPAGAAAVALLVLAGIGLLRSILPGLMSLDLLPWRSAVLALQLERPG